MTNVSRRSLLLAAAALAASGCRSRTDPGPRDLVWAVGGIDAAPGGPANAVADLWNRSPVRPRVRIAALPSSADEQRRTMAIELNAGLDGLDVLTLDVPWTGEFAANRWIVDLSGLRRVVGRGSIPALVRSATWGGRLWAAPFSANAGLLYYRTDLVAQPPTSWPDLVRVGLQAAGSEGIAAFVGQGAQYEGMVVQFLELLWGAGGDLFNETGGRVDFGAAPALRALAFLAEARRSGFLARDFPTMTEEGARAAFQSGGAVFMRNWPYAQRLLLERGSPVAGRFGIAPLPTFAGTGTVSALGGQNLAVSRNSRNRAAAMQFVEFASTDLAAQLALAGHAVPPAMTSAYAELRSDPVMQLLERVLPEARPRPPVPQWSAISDEIQQHVFPAYTGHGDPARAVDDLRAFLQLTVSDG